MKSPRFRKEIPAESYWGHETNVETGFLGPRPRGPEPLHAGPRTCARTAHLHRPCASRPGGRKIILFHFYLFIYFYLILLFIYF